MNSLFHILLSNCYPLLCLWASYLERQVGVAGQYEYLQNTDRVGAPRVGHLQIYSFEINTIPKNKLIYANDKWVLYVQITNSNWLTNNEGNS